MKAVTSVRPPKGFFKNNRERLVLAMKNKISSSNENSFILLKGNNPTMIYDDGNFLFSPHVFNIIRLGIPFCLGSSFLVVHRS